MIHSILTFKVHINALLLAYLSLSGVFVGIYLEDIRSAADSWGKLWQRIGILIFLVLLAELILPVYVAGALILSALERLYDWIDTKIAIKQWIRLWWYGEITLHRDDYDLTRFQRYEDAGNWNLQWSQKKYYERLKAYNKVRWDELLEARNK